MSYSHQFETDKGVYRLLTRMLTERGTYDSEDALRAYQFWLDSDPFDCGMTIATGLRGRPNLDSQANGAMMRISPLASSEPTTHWKPWVTGQNRTPH